MAVMRAFFMVQSPRSEVQSLLDLGHWTSDIGLLLNRLSAHTTRLPMVDAFVL